MAEKKWWNNPWACGAGGCCLGCIVIPLIMIGIFGVGMVGLISQSGVYEDAAELARNHPQVIERLGEPVDSGWPRDVSVQMNNNKGSASLELPLSGPKGSGVLYVEAEKSGGEWEYRRLTLVLDDGSGSLDLLPSSPPVEAMPGSASSSSESV